MYAIDLVLPVLKIKNLDSPYIDVFIFKEHIRENFQPFYKNANIIFNKNIVLISSFSYNPEKYPSLGEDIPAIVKEIERFLRGIGIKYRSLPYRLLREYNV